MWTDKAGIELSRASLRVSRICICLDRIRREVGCQQAMGSAHGSQGMSFSWVYGKIDREELQKVGCSND